jgi:hypothetical protein
MHLGGTFDVIRALPFPAELSPGAPFLPCEDVAGSNGS